MNSKIKKSFLNDGLEIRDYKDGKGVFAKDYIKKGEVCAIFGGHIISLKQERELPDGMNDTGIQISEEFVMSSLDSKEDTDYFNHSCEPNAGISGQIILVAMRDILKDEQVTFDYAMCSSFSATFSPVFYEFKCNCEMPSCRGFISDDDWKKHELQNKYLGYFSRYIQDKIDKKDFK